MINQQFRRVIALLAVVGAVLLAASPSASVLVWPAVIFTAWSASAWNTVGMLAIIQSLPPSRAGRGSGVVLLGFLAGLGVGAPIFGWSVDRWGTYAASWLVVAVVFGAGGLVLRGLPAGLRP